MASTHLAKKKKAKADTSQQRQCTSTKAISVDKGGYMLAKGDTRRQRKIRVGNSEYASARSMSASSKLDD